MALSVDRTLSKARTLKRRGRVGEARALCDDLLSRFPGNTRVRAELRRLDQAPPQCTARPALVPSADIHCRNGRRLAAEGDLIGAAAAFSEAVKEAPDSAEAYSGLGLVFLRQEDFANAALALNAATGLDPDLSDAWSNLGAAFLELGRHAAALDALDAAIARDPSIAQAHNNRGLALRGLGRMDDAIASFERAITLAPDFNAARSNLGSLLRIAGRHEAALKTLRTAARIDPDFAEGQNNLAAVFGDLGRFDEARAAYRRAIRIRPDFAHAHYNLALLTRYEPGDDHIETMNALLERARSRDAKLHFNFALGKAADDCGETETAFRHFAEGNRIRRESAPYDRARAEMMLKDIEERVSAAEPLDDPGGPLRPIFIVGMPRSGTTLIEQILSAHSTVTGGGEMTDWARFARETMREAGVPDSERLSALRARYLDNLAHLGFQGVVTEKLPANYAWTGLIAKTLPEAVILDVRRDPRAVSWSIFRTYFSASGNDYAYGLDDIAQHYGLFRRTMGFWAGRLPQRVHRIEYEALTEDQEGQTRRLLEVCRLPFEDQCLAFHRSGRAVNTASAAQVRKRLYTGSSEKWRAYEPWLGPLIDGLKREGLLPAADASAVARSS